MVLNRHIIPEKEQVLILKHRFFVLFVLACFFFFFCQPFIGISPRIRRLLFGLSLIIKVYTSYQIISDVVILL